MRLLTVEGDGVAFDTFCAEDRRERQAHAFEDRALLDVEFDIGGGVFLFARRFGKAIDLHAAAA